MPLTPAERQARRRAGLARARTPIEHGTRAGYRRHRRGPAADEWPAEPCGPCSEANAAHYQALRARP